MSVSTDSGFTTGRTASPQTPTTAGQTVTQAKNTLADYAVGGLIALMSVLVAVLVGSKFVAAIPSTSVFSSALDTVVTSASTMFVLFGVGLLVLGAVAIIRIVRGGFGRGGGR